MPRNIKSFITTKELAILTYPLIFVKSGKPLKQ